MNWQINMPLSDNQRAYVRSEIGSADPPSDGDLDDRYDALGSVAGVILEVLRSRRADLIAGGLTTSFSVTGFYSETSSVTDLLRALDAQIARILADACAIDDDDWLGGHIRVSRMVRAGYDRRPTSRYPSTLA